MNEYTSKNPMVTIIIPVYNVESYLRRCVDSVLSQEYTDFELFLVDNGSTVNHTLQKLSSREYIKITDVHVKGTRKNKEAKASNGRKIHIAFLPPCEKILGETAEALKNMDAAWFARFTLKQLQKRV